jgi:predicted ester cyclase
MFPDIKLTIEEQVAEGNVVSTRMTVEGTHKVACPESLEHAESVYPLPG